MAWKCQDCRYFEPDSGSVKAEMGGSEAVSSYGDCRHSPPVVLPGRQLAAAAGGQLYRPIDRWPHVQTDQWCGEWAQRDEQRLGGR